MAPRQHDTQRIVERLRALRPESPPRWGRMTAHQMVCHLADALRMATGERPIVRAPSALERTLVKWIALYVPLRWPAGIPTAAKLDQQRGGTTPRDFGADLQELERLLDRFLETGASGAADRHPIFGRMSRGDWLRWAHRHADHHLRQFGV